MKKDGDNIARYYLLKEFEHHIYKKRTPKPKEESSAIISADEPKLQLESDEPISTTTSFEAMNTKEVLKLPIQGTVKPDTSLKIPLEEVIALAKFIIRVKRIILMLNY